MTCIHCGGHHESDLCHGYNSYSMSKSLDEISSGIDSFTELTENSLDDISNKYSEIIQTQERIAESNEVIGENINNAANQIANNIEDAGTEISESLNKISSTNEIGYNKVSDSISKAGFNSMVGNIISGAMISSALIGIGAILKYRERMEQLRHKEKMGFKEETSDAGKARRELKTAASLLFAGDPKQAQSHIQNSLKYFPSSAETFRIRSIIESREEKHTEAIISLKTSLKLAEEKCFYPSILNIDGSITDELYETIYTTSLAQLSQELALIGMTNQAIEYLNHGIGNFPKNTDLHFQRLRMLNKTDLWDNSYEDYLIKLIELSPQHFNIVYTDLQLTKRKSELQNTLKKIKSEKVNILLNKRQTLNVLTEGKSENGTLPINSKDLHDFSYAKIVKLSKEYTLEIKRRIDDKKT